MFPQKNTQRSRNDKDDEMNYGILISLSSLGTDSNRAVNKMKNCFDLLHKFEVSHLTLMTLVVFRHLLEPTFVLFQLVNQLWKENDNSGIPQAWPSVKMIKRAFCIQNLGQGKIY